MAGCDGRRADGWQDMPMETTCVPTAQPGGKDEHCHRTRAFAQALVALSSPICLAIGNGPGLAAADDQNPSIGHCSLRRSGGHYIGAKGKMKDQDLCLPIS